MHELDRYIEYLQGRTSSPFTAHLNDRAPFREWVRTNRARLQKLAHESGGEVDIDDFEAFLSREPPRPSRYESTIARAIFTPLLKEVLAQAKEVNLGIKRGIIFANATNAGPGAMSVPSTHEHLLFAGAGTYMFCNYWAKVVANVALACRRAFGPRPITKRRLQQLWPQRVDLIATAVRLTMYSRLLGTVIGFGRLPTSAEAGGFRVELLSAMESFAVAHEVGHCFIEEREPSREASQEDELSCDAYSWCINRMIGMRDGNWSMASGAAAYTFLKAAAISNGRTVSREIETHPAATKRAVAIRQLAIESAAGRQAVAIRRYLKEIDVMFEEISRRCDMVHVPRR